jgi:DNA-binding NarL/FixJ family response regulator
MAEPELKRVMVVDDHPMVRQSLTFALVPQGLLVVGEASSRLEAIKSCPKLRPDIIMMDVKCRAWVVSKPHVLFIRFTRYESSFHQL